MSSRWSSRSRSRATRIQTSLLIAPLRRSCDEGSRSASSSSGAGAGSPASGPRSRRRRRPRGVPGSGRSRKRYGAADAIGRVLAHPVFTRRARRAWPSPPRRRRSGPSRPRASSIPSSSRRSRRMSERQGQPLADERGEDDGEREEEDQVAAGKRRRRHRSRAAVRAPPRARVHLASRPRRGSGAAPARHPPARSTSAHGYREDPGEPEDDHGEADERRVAQERRGRDVASASMTTGSWRPTSTNRSAFRRYWTISQTATPCRRTWGGVSSRGVPAEVDARGHGREHGGDARSARPG